LSPTSILPTLRLNLRIEAASAAIALLLLFPATGQSQEAVRIAVETRISELRFGDAAALLARLTDAADREYYRSRITLYKILLTDDPAFLDSFSASCESTIAALNAAPQTGRIQSMLAEIRLIRGLVRFLNENYFGAATDFAASCEIASKCSKDFPASPHPAKVMGIYHLALSAVPEKWEWLAGLLCFRGNAEEGKGLLSQHSMEGSLLPLESEIVLFFYEKNFISRPDLALKRVAGLGTKFPKSPLIALLYASALMEGGNPARAMQWIENQYPESEDTSVFHTPARELYLARAQMFSENYSIAAVSFREFLDSYKGDAYRGDAQYRMGICLELSGKRQQAAEVFDEIKGSNAGNTDADEYAAAMSEIYSGRAMTSFEKILYRSRILSDAGNPSSSNAILFPLVDSVSRMTEDEKTELYYRFGRNYDKSENRQLAKFYYLTCAGSSPVINLWMKNYSHYYLGKIRVLEGEIESGIRDYKSALESDGYFYQDGLERMCKSAMRDAENSSIYPKVKNGP